MLPAPSIAATPTSVEAFERETFRGALALGEKALIALGTAPDEARRVADAFEAHDESLLTQSYALRDDRDAYIGFVRRSTDMLDRVMRADRDAQEAPPHEDKAAE